MVHCILQFVFDTGISSCFKSLIIVKSVFSLVCASSSRVLSVIIRIIPIIAAQMEIGCKNDGQGILHSALILFHITCCRFAKLVGGRWNVTDNRSLASVFLHKENGPWISQPSQLKTLTARRPWCWVGYFHRWQKIAIRNHPLCVCVCVRARVRVCVCVCLPLYCYY